MGLVCVVAVALLTACSPQPGAGPTPVATSTTAPAPPSTAPAPPSTAPAATITIKDFEFGVPVSVPAGATITVVNDDSMTHTVTSTGDGGAFDVTVLGGATGTFTAPAQAGTYDFVCSFHGNMTGTLVVA